MMRLRDIAAMLGGEIDPQGRSPEAADMDIARVAKIEEAGQGDITFLANPKYTKYLSQTHASAVIVARDLQEPPPPGGMLPVLVRVADPYVSFLKVLVAMHPPGPPLPEGIHPTAVVAASAVLGEGVRLGAYAMIGERTRVGARSMIGHGSILAEDVQLGEDSVLYQNVTVREGCRIGSRVIVQPGAVIGSDGFGFAPRADGTYEKIPQLGIVVIEDDVEIGANTTIDRATLGETRIGRGAKLDNLIQIAHNVVVGPHTVIAAQSGISGSTRLGSHCMIAGQVGFTGHLEIADRTKIGAQSGIHRSITEPGRAYFGTPAWPQREAFRIQGAITQLPDTLAEVRELKKKIAELEAQLARRAEGES